MRAKLSGIVDVVLALSAVLVAVVVVLRYTGVARHSPTRPAYKVGELLPNLPGVNFGSSDKTLLMWLRSTCHFCTASMPFYRDIVSARARQPGLQLIAIGGEDGAVLSEYLKENKLDVDQVVKIASGPLASQPTPTLILADRSQRVAGVWIGRLGKEKEEALMKASGVCESCGSLTERRIR
jgi:hypothetical protein